MKNLGIILTLAVVACVFHTSSGNNMTTVADNSTAVIAGAQATTAPDITVNLNMTFSGTWDPIYSDNTHENTTDLKTAICNAVTNAADKVKTCMVNSFSAGSIIADMTLTAAGTENSGSVTTNVNNVKATIAASVTSAGFNIGAISNVVDTTSTATTTAPSTATTLSPSVIMYLTVLCATAKVVLF